MFWHSLTPPPKRDQIFTFETDRTKGLHFIGNLKIHLFTASPLFPLHYDIFVNCIECTGCAKSPESSYKNGRYSKWNGRCEEKQTKKDSEFLNFFKLHSFSRKKWNWLIHFYLHFVLKNKHTHLMLILQIDTGINWGQDVTIHGSIVWKWWAIRWKGSLDFQRVYLLNSRQSRWSFFSTSCGKMSRNVWKCFLLCPDVCAPIQMVLCTCSN